jgi:hypothetical protein
LPINHLFAWQPYFSIARFDGVHRRSSTILPTVSNSENHTYPPQEDRLRLLSARSMSLQEQIQNQLTTGASDAKS